MKVLFAVNNEEISESIVKKYQKQFKEIISYKNVYYFNAILKELQKEKNYDRIVISEELEAFTNTQYAQIDKFIFEKLDSISDEASNQRGEDIPIILICSDRREKSEEMLVKLFGIGIYNALIGNDRSLENVCSLLNKPRVKKEAKSYYKIDSDDVTYQAESENDVSEIEIQNILAHYKRLGKDEKRYVDSFDNIASQYNDVQLRIISKFLPLNVRAVLEERSPKYQQIIAFNSKVSDTLRSQNPKKQEPKKGTSEKLLNTENRENTLSKPVIIPSSVNMNGARKLSKPMQRNEGLGIYGKTVTDVKKIGPMFEEKTEDIKDFEEDETVLPGFADLDDDILNDEPEEKNETIQRPAEYIDPIRPIRQTESIEPEDTTEIAEQLKQEEIPAVEPKRGRGRPRKYPVQEVDPNKPKRGRGRPRKSLIPEDLHIPEIKEDKDDDLSSILPGFNEEPEQDETILPGFDDFEDKKEDETILPGFEDFDTEVDNDDDENDINDLSQILPEFAEEKQEKEEETEIRDYGNTNGQIQEDYDNQNVNNKYEDKFNSVEEDDDDEYEEEDSGKLVTRTTYTENSHHTLKPIEEPIEDVDISGLLSANKKIATFIGTSKNGTSFIVNNLAEITSQMGIDTAILDTTKNRNSYYIYTKNEEDLRNVAMDCISNLVDGNARGIPVKRNLTVYTALPDESDGIANAGKILQTLLQKHSLILIDCDFNTPIGYFAKAQEIYLVQSYDILTIQPLTAFLRELKAKDILTQNKLKVVLNKAIRVRGVNDKAIIGGMAFYNDPSMSYMTELFDKNTIRSITIPFNEDVYSRYLEGVINCEISVKGYPKSVVQTLSELANTVYPMVSGGRPAYTPPQKQNNNGFSDSVNSTLDQMRRF